MVESEDIPNILNTGYGQFEMSQNSHGTFHSSCSTVAEAAGICYLPSLPFEDFQKQPWATSEVRAGASREAGGRLEPLKTEAGDV